MLRLIMFMRPVILIVNVPVGLKDAIWGPRQLGLLRPPQRPLPRGGVGDHSNPANNEPAGESATKTGTGTANADGD